MKMLRSALAVVVGLLLISLIVEPLEFVLVRVVSGAAIADQEMYFAVRNQSAILAAKLFYNTAAAIVGGFVAARLARRAPLAHGVVLAAVQTVAFGWALVTPELRRTTPDWMWASLIVLTFAGIVAGSLLQRRRWAKTHKPPPTGGASV
jgi:MFS family permease